MSGIYQDERLVRLSLSVLRIYVCRLFCRVQIFAKQTAREPHKMAISESESSVGEVGEKRNGRESAGNKISAVC